MMILANYMAADTLHKHSHPCPYRFQEKPRLAEGAELMPDGDAADPDVKLALNLAARRRTGRSGLSFVPSAHYGLGLPVYTAFTAPMRRYVDLLVARQLRAVSDNASGPLMNEQEFLRLALPAHELQQRIQKMQNNRQRYWLMTYLADCLGRDFSAIVFEQRDRRLKVCVTEYMLETDVFLPRGDSSPPKMFGRRVQVKLVEAEPGENMPRFVLV
jgi:exoribonuclease-2